MSNSNMIARSMTRSRVVVVLTRPVTTAIRQPRTYPNPSSPPPRSRRRAGRARPLRRLYRWTAVVFLCRGCGHCHERLAEADEDFGDRGADAAAAQHPRAVRRTQQRGQDNAVEPPEIGPGTGVAENDRSHCRVYRRKVCL